MGSEDRPLCDGNLFVAPSPPSTMTREAVIRSYVHSEDENKLARFTVAKAAMEPLAVANFNCTNSIIYTEVWSHFAEQLRHIL